MEDVGIATGQPPEIVRLDGTNTLVMTFRGTRDRAVRDRDTRVRITLSGAQAGVLWRLLGEQLSDADRGSPDPAF